MEGSPEGRVPLAPSAEERSPRRRIKRQSPVLTSIYPYECQRKSEPGADELIRLEVIDYITDSTVYDVMKKRD